MNLNFQFLEFPKRKAGGFGGNGTETCKACFSFMLPYAQKAKRILEIGTGAGWTTINFALHSPPDAHIWTIDGNADVWWDSDMAEHLELCKKITRHIENTRLFDYGANGISNMDLVFIDANHDCPDVRLDTENAMRALRPGGHIFWHDYCPGRKCGVVEAIEELKIPVYMELFGLAHWQSPGGTQKESGK